MQKQLDRERRGGSSTGGAGYGGGSSSGAGSSSAGPAPRPTLGSEGRNQSDASIRVPHVQPSPSSSGDPQSLAQENDSLVQRLAEAQTRSWDLEEQLRTSKLRTKNQDEELKVKTEVIQQYMLREFAGELKPLPPHVASTLALANDGSAVAMVLSGEKSSNVSPMKAAQMAESGSPARTPKRGKVR